MYSWGPERYGIRRVVDQMPEYPLRRAAVDFEYDGNKFVGVGVYGGGPYVYYFTKLTEEVRRLLCNLEILGHYFKSDLRMSYLWDLLIPIKNVVGDTFINSYVKDAGAEGHGLKQLCRTHLKMEWPDYNDLVPKVGRKKAEFADLPVELQSSYNGMDAIGTYRLNVFDEMYLTPYEKWYVNTYELPLMQLLFLMERKGVKIDVPYLAPLARELEQEVLQRRKHVCDTFGFEFNPNSAQQKVQALNVIGIKVKGSNRKFDLDPHKLKPAVAALIEYTKVQKIASTYSTKLAALALRDQEHRIYGEFNQDTNTGRLSSKGPNLQNIPSRGDLGKKIRKAFVVGEGNVWLSADYSQIDLRCLAHESQEPVWCEAFRNGGDPHKSTAAKGFRVGFDQVSDDQRRTAKTVNFAEAYGSGPFNIAYELQCPLEDAKKFQRAVQEGLPTFVGWRTRNHQIAAREVGARTLFGRWISLPGIRSSDMGTQRHFERRADSIKGQGSAGEIVKAAMIRIWKELGQIPISQVHDELNFEIKRNEADDLKPEIKRIMESAAQLRVPLEVKVSVGPNWAEAKP